MSCRVRVIIMSSVLLSLAGCGVAETGAAAGTAAAAKAQEAQQGLQTEARVREQLDSALNQDAARRRAAEAQAQ